MSGRVTYPNKAGERCDSKYEVMLTNQLWDRGIEYIIHPGPFWFSSAVRAGFCEDCDGHNIRKGRMYTPDLLIVPSGVIIEAKGGTTTAKARGALRDFVNNNVDKVQLHFMFRYNRPIKKGSKTTHRRWAMNLKCPVHIGETIPEEWIRGN